MKAILITAIAIFSGVLLCSFLEVYLLDRLFELPSRNFLDNPENVKVFIENLSLGSQFFIVISRTLGAFLAAYGASSIAGTNFGWLAGSVITLFTLVGVFQIEHPLWMAAAMVLGTLLGTAIGTALGGKRKAEISSSY